mgnify:FL=1
MDINQLSGNIYDANARITPFKLMRARQIYDVKNRYLITPKMFGEGGFWSEFDWNKAAGLGMAVSGLEYSGQYDFVETRMYWPINHMVAPASKSLKCTVCHTRKESKRLDWQQLGYKGDPMTVGGRAK